MDTRPLRRVVRLVAPRVTSGLLLVGTLVGFAVGRRALATWLSPEAELQPAALFGQYAGMVVDVLTMDITVPTREGSVWVGTALAEAAVPTAAYVLPALVLAVPLGTVIGVTGALWKRQLVGKLATAVGYVGMALPEFVVAVLAVEYLIRYAGWVQVHWGTRPPMAPANVEGYAVMAAVLAGQVVAVQVAYTRSAVADELTAEYVTTVRSKGGGPRSVLRHVAPNALPTVLSSTITRLVPFLVLEVVVLEHRYVFGVDGLGAHLLGAMRGSSAEAALVLVLAAAPVFLGTVVEDAVQRRIDPRL